MSFHAEKCCYLVTEHNASARSYAAAYISSCSVVHSFLFDENFLRLFNIYTVNLTVFGKILLAICANVNWGTMHILASRQTANT